MKKQIFLLMLSLSTIVSAQTNGISRETQNKVVTVLKKYIDLGIPGIALTVYNEDKGYWSHAEGVSDIEKQTSITEDHLFYLQSVSKTYMAVIILQLYEAGRLDLEDKITDYLNYEWLTKIDGVEKVTIKTLLNHTSGLAEYSTNPTLVSKIIQNPQDVLTVEEMVSHIANRPLEFQPGSKYSYRNTNYALLSLLADAITTDHMGYMKKTIFEKLGLHSTIYLSKDNLKKELNIVEAYWDVLLEGIPVNISLLQRANVSSMKGDDGMVATTKDAIGFLHGLVTGKLLGPQSLELMQEFTVNEKGEKKYGLGIQYYDLEVTYAIGHSGGGIGAGCLLLYLPELNSYVFIATNFNTMMESPIRKKAENLQMDILLALFTET
ncbi:serine hydrolase domain-containing protein [uncultured Croceitalea sp.]|uniref:serine hydrolase domain-containing protein n=1 Tax=uncultured Croceitalea sp. TaxID=1798908 RepID=UPI0033056165